MFFQSHSSPTILAPEGDDRVTVGRSPDDVRAHVVDRRTRERLAVAVECQVTRSVRRSGKLAFVNEPGPRTPSYLAKSAVTWHLQGRASPPNLFPKHRSAVKRDGFKTRNSVRLARLDSASRELRESNRQFAVEVSTGNRQRVNAMRDTSNKLLRQLNAGLLKARFFLETRSQSRDDLLVPAPLMSGLAVRSFAQHLL